MVNWENVGSSVNKHSANLIHVLGLKSWGKCQIIGGFWELQKLTFRMHAMKATPESDAGVKISPSKCQRGLRIEILTPNQICNHKKDDCPANRTESESG